MAPKITDDDCTVDEVGTLTIRASMLATEGVPKEIVLEDEVFSLHARLVGKDDDVLG